jgi:hypothetical protein
MVMANNYDAFLAYASTSSSSTTVEDENKILLEDFGLLQDFEEMEQQQLALLQLKEQQEAQLAVFRQNKLAALKAAKLLEAKASLVENLVTEMEEAGLLPDQLEATKKRLAADAVAALEAAKLHKQRIAKLLGDKKLK